MSSQHKPSFQLLATQVLQIVQNHLMLPTAFRYVEVLTEKLPSLQDEIVESHVKYYQKSSSQDQQQETTEQLRERLTASFAQELHCTAAFDEMRSKLRNELTDLIETNNYAICAQYLPQTFLTVSTIIVLATQCIRLTFKICTGG
jgi:predicted nucleotide-binding protein (sugar kinase/HSP70/actin superfamily)